MRAGISDALTHRFTEWLEEASGQLASSPARLPSDPVRFAFRDAQDARPLIGVLRGSADRVGRSFPLAVFVPATGALVTRSFPDVPAAYRRFLDAAAALLADAHTADAPEMAERARGLPLPAAAELDSAHADGRTSSTRSGGGSLCARLFGEQDVGRCWYAFHTLASACLPLRARAPTSAEVILDCPLVREEDVSAWLELVRRGLQWSSSPAFFWRAAEPARLLVALGAAPPSMLQSFAEPRRDGRRVWPLETTDARATAAARLALGEPRCAAIDRADTLEEVAVALFG